MKKTVSLFLALLILAAALLCGCGEAEKPYAIADNYRVFYEIFVGSFSDSDGDGTGDLRGIINRMDYLCGEKEGEGLGVQGLWLSPVFSSPSYHKYDAADYYKIDPAFGDYETFGELIRLCHERNVSVIIDLPINHTSNANVWFQKFTNAHKSGDTQNEFYDYYTHCDAAGRKGGRAYSQIPGCTGEYYECNFSTDMPELNFDNENVRRAVVDVAKYYLDLGVDGFRFDAIKYIYYSNTNLSSEFWEWYMAELRAIKEDIYCVGECWSADAETLKYIEALNCFNFSMSQSEGFIANAAKGAQIGIYTNYVENYQKSVKAARADAMMIPFISNHDMDRCSGYLTLATKRMYMGANLYILCAGSPFIYYGEEIGMRGTRGAAQTDANRRLAMLWGDGDTVRDPVGTTYSPSKQTNGTVAWQKETEDSLLNYYSRLISLRNKYPEIARGDYKALTYSDSRFGGFLITYGETVTGLFHNTSDREITVDLKDSGSVFEYSFEAVCDYIGQGEASLVGSVLTLGPQTSVIIK